MFVSTSEFPGVLSVLTHFVCRLAGVLVTCQIILKTPILRTDVPSSQHTDRQLPTRHNLGGLPSPGPVLLHSHACITVFSPFKSILSGDFGRKKCRDFDFC